MIEEGRLWKVADKYSIRTSWVECIPSREGFNTALKIHQDNGHWDVDHVKLHVRDHYFWPHIDSDARLTILMCGHCKNFGPIKRNALLQPIIRGCPFKFLAADYLKLPKGKGKMLNVLLFVDVCSQFIWGQKQATARSSKTTEKLLRRISQEYASPRVWQVDGGSHFLGEELKRTCEELNIVKITTQHTHPSLMASLRIPTNS
jgi:transposase InsO family protein